MGDPMWFYIEFFHVMGFYIIYGFQPNFNKTTMENGHAEVLCFFPWPFC